jgi:hypothetical protein
MSIYVLLWEILARKLEVTVVYTQYVYNMVACNISFTAITVFADEKFLWMLGAWAYLVTI